MKKQIPIILALLLCPSRLFLGQTPSPTPQAQQTDADVVRITANLVQMDAVLEHSGPIVRTALLLKK